MKKRKIITVVTFIMILFGVLFFPQNYSNDTVMEVYAASASSGAVKLDPSVITYDSISDESKQIPCEARGGIYFLNDNKLTFYSLSTKKSTLVYTFGNGKFGSGNTSLVYLQDTYVENNSKLYVLEYDYNKDQAIITMYDLIGQKVERTLIVDIFATIIGTDNSGRIFLVGYENSNYVIYLLSSAGKVLSKAVSESSIYDFIAYDKTNGNFYFEGYYNWIYWGYDHSMHALRAGRVIGNNIQITEDPVLLISQSYFYERQDPVELLGNKYLCVDSTFESGLYVINSNKLNPSLQTMSASYFERNIYNTAGDFESTAAVGSRTVYFEKNNSIVTFVDNKTLVEYDLSTEEEIARVSTAYPVFSLMKYDDSIIAIEKNGNNFYIETFPWKRATYVKITASSKSMSIGSTMQLTASTDSTLAERYSWSTSNNKVVSVTDSGEVTAWSAGTAVITVTTSQGLKGTYTITVGSGLSVQDPKKSNTVTKGTVSSNISKNNYSVYGKVMNSYLAQNTDGTLTRVEYINNQVIVETYSADGATLKSTKKITPKLSLFGGFYSGSSYNYLVFGQTNPSYSDSREVMRVVKYSKDWNEISSVSVKGANTYYPFDAGSLRMTEANGKLYIHTCHLMYDEGDGLNHQANMTFVINEDKMTVEQSYFDVMNIAQAGYVSHSFNQFVQADDKYLYRVDHGDGYPRGITITRCDLNGKITNVIYTIPINLSKVNGYNDTGASIGGFELSSANCIIAGNAVDYTKSNADSYGNRNIFVSVTDKNLSQPKVIWLTKYSDSQNISVYTPQLTKLGNNKFLIMWEEYYSNTQKTYTRMATIDDRGNLTSDVIYSDARLSDCHPILCKDGLVRWYTTNNNAPTIYAVNPYHLSHIQASDVITLNSPKLSAVENVNGGVKISWGKVTGASKYRIYYKTGSGSWTKLADTTSTSYTWTGATSGTKYTFTVRCLSSDAKSFTSNYDKTGKSITYVAAPKLSSVSNTATGVNITWGKVSGAEKYRVYYKTAGGSWTRIADTTSTSYTWTGAKSGTTYTFTVRCINSAATAFTSDFDSVGKSIMYLSQPKISKIEADNSGVKITWGKVTGAKTYRVYYMSANGWYMLKETSDTSFTLNAVKGNTYKYTVKALNGSTASSYHSGTSFKRLETPVLSGVSNTSNGVKVSWGAVNGAAKYRVYYKTGNGSWTRIADTTSTSYTWAGAKSGTTYTFTVRCLSSDGTVFTSGFDATGKKITYIK